MGMKRSCNGCRADGRNCDLGYKRKSTYNPLHSFPIRGFKPLQECPKPKTYEEFIKLLNSR